MKKLIRTLLSCGLFGAAAILAHAQAAPKIAVVDMEKIFNSHYETIAEQAKLKADSQKAQADLDQMRKDAQDLYNQAKEAADQMNNPTATPDAKAKAQSDAQQKQQLLQQKVNDMNQFKQNAQQTIQQRIMQFRSMLLDQISQVVIAIAKQDGDTLVIDKSGPTAAGIPAVIYSDPSYDITQQVMDQINKNRPAGTESESMPTPNPASVPQITVPNVAPPAQ